jgi:hypothetical protein
LALLVGSGKALCPPTSCGECQEPHELPRPTSKVKFANQGTNRVKGLFATHVDSYHMSHSHTKILWRNSTHISKRNHENPEFCKSKHMEQREKLKKKYTTSRIDGTAREIRLERCVVEF